MKWLKNIAVGFLVSFVGSLPLGYLNIIGFQIHESYGLEQLLYYLLGVIVIEGLVIYATLIFANRLTANKKLLRFIEIFSIFFMLLLAFVFWSQAHAESTEAKHYETAFSPFLTGIVFSSLNFVQIPFWVGWNLYLINGKYISLSFKPAYIAGTLVGTFGGMLAFILFLHAVTEQSANLQTYFLKWIIPLFFVGMAIFQSYKFYRKHRNRKT